MATTKPNEKEKESKSQESDVAAQPDNRVDSMPPTEAAPDKIHLPLELFLAHLIGKAATDPKTMPFIRSEIHRYWEQFTSETRKQTYHETKQRFARFAQIAEAISQEFASASAQDS